MARHTHWLDDLDETVHLILMENPNIKMAEALAKAREVHPGLEVRDFSHAWTPYKGFDGRIPPTKKI